MDFNFDKDRIISQLKSRIYAVISLAAILAFVFFSYSVFSSPAPAKENIPNYNELMKNPYKKYEKYLNRKSIEDLKSNPQFTEMEHNKNLIPAKEIYRREDPFVKSF